MKNWQSKSNLKKKNQTSSISLTVLEMSVFLSSKLYLRVWFKGKKNKNKKEDRSWININSIKYPNLGTQMFKAILKKKKYR